MAYAMTFAIGVAVGYAAARPDKVTRAIEMARAWNQQRLARRRSQQ